MQQDIVKQLSRYGINVRQHNRPVAKHLFTIGIRRDHPEGTILINQGIASVRVSGDRKLRQATVSVREKARNATRQVQAIMTQNARPTREQARSQLISRYPIVMPEGTTWDVKKVRITPMTEWGNTDKSWRIGGFVTAHAKPTINHLFMGMDETHHFISVLPRHASSVKEAHQILRPKGLGKKARRQGEWFFDPCEQRTRRMLERKVFYRPSIVTERKLGSTTHRAKETVDLNGVIYARGYIVESPNRGHHKPFFLKTWHKVVKNKETVMKVNPEQAEAARRRQLSFD